MIPLLIKKIRKQIREWNGLVSRELLDSKVSALELNGFVNWAFGGEELQGTIREVTVEEDGEEFFAHGTGDAHDDHGRVWFLQRHADFGGEFVCLKLGLWGGNEIGFERVAERSHWV